MFSLFILPFEVRNDPYYLEWVLFRSVDKARDLALLMPSYYWESASARIETGVWSTLPGITSYLRYEIPKAEQLSRLKKLPLNARALERLSRELIGPAQIWTHTILHRVPELEFEIERALEGNCSIEGVFLWHNCASMSSVAKKRGLPTIHHELGPLRPPYFHLTAYFDFKGVNGNTDAAQRWKAFKKEGQKVPILSRHELMEIVCLNRTTPDESITHELGVALQMPDDSNMLAFSRGFDNYGLIATAERYFSGRKLVRAHPGSPDIYSKLSVDWDQAPNPAQFLDQVHSILTINSSLAFEAMLIGKPTYVLGDSPFSTASWDILKKEPKLTDDEMLLWLNWFIFGYLIPYDRSFNVDYCRWRLKLPSEIEIYIDNLNYWRGTLCDRGV